MNGISAFSPTSCNKPLLNDLKSSNEINGTIIYACLRCAKESSNWLMETLSFGLCTDETLTLSHFSLKFPGLEMERQVCQLDCFLGIAKELELKVHSSTTLFLLELDGRSECLMILGSEDDCLLDYLVLIALIQLSYLCKNGLKNWENKGIQNI